MTRGALAAIRDEKKFAVRVWGANFGSQKIILSAGGTSWS